MGMAIGQAMGGPWVLSSVCILELSPGSLSKKRPYRVYANVNFTPPVNTKNFRPDANSLQIGLEQLLELR